MIIAVAFFILLVKVTQTRIRKCNRGKSFLWRRYCRYRIRIRPTKPSTTPTTRPATQTIAITQDKCKAIVDKIPIERIEGPICLRLNESQLLTKLKKVGSFNSRYMAINSEEARNFVDLIADQSTPPTNISSFGTQNASQGNQQILWNITQNLLRQQDQEEDGIRKLSSREVTNMRSCRFQGDPVAGSRLRLCTECQASTQLADGAFPPYINEVICGSERFCLRNIGDCQPQRITFTFLRSTGNYAKDDDFDEDFGEDVYPQQMETYDQDIRVCCQCRGFSSIFWPNLKESLTTK